MSENTVPTTVDRPLNTTQARALTKLVTNDFDRLIIDIRRAAIHRSQEVEEEVRRQWALDHPDSSAKSLAEAASAAARRYNTSIARIRKEAQEAGVRFSSGGRQTLSTDAECVDQALEEAVQKARAAVTEQQREAERQVQARRLETERKILLASITPATEVLLAALPTAAEMLALNSGSEQ